MNDKSVLKPIHPLSSAQTQTANPRSAANASKLLPAEEAVVNTVKPELTSESAAKEAERLAASLSSSGSKGLDAIKSLDEQAIQRLLADD